jgi:cobalt-zinc-cadmium efflux system membrane fusion protein
VGLAAAALALVALGFWLRGRGAVEGAASGAPIAVPITAPIAAPLPGHPASLALAVRAREGNPIKIAPARMVRLGGNVQVVGTVAFHEDHFAVVGPLVAGRVARLAAGVGDQVKRGQLLAEIESAEIGQARADLIAAKARYVAADANLRRESELAEKKISSSRERELAQAQWGIEQAGVRAATMRLRALGLSDAEIADVDRTALGGKLQIRAPIGGTIIERRVTLGQAVERATDAFKIADTSLVWVSLDLYEKDLGRVHAGQEVELHTDARPGEPLRGRVAFVVPVIDETTRTAKVRLEFPNPKGILQAGQLVTAQIFCDPRQDAAEVLAVPRSAIERLEGQTIVFVAGAGVGDFERRNVVLGMSGVDEVEVSQGLAAGERVAVEGAFLLKSELLR